MGLLYMTPLRLHGRNTARPTMPNRMNGWTKAAGPSGADAIEIPEERPGSAEGKVVPITSIMIVRR